MLYLLKFLSLFISLLLFVFYHHYYYCYWFLFSYIRENFFSTVISTFIYIRFLFNTLDIKELLYKYLQLLYMIICTFKHLIARLLEG